jgi:endonuclease III
VAETTTGTTGTTLERLLERHGRRFADELGILLDEGGPTELFQLLTAALLMSARIRSDVAVAAARALYEHGCTDAQAMVDTSWQERVDALGEGSYVRYDESTATYLGETAQLVLDRYDGDLNQLREAAEHDPGRIHSLLQECKGIGRVGADIFCREAQRVWPELRPFADAAAVEVAEQLGLGSSPEELVELIEDDDLSRLTAALIRADRVDDLAQLRAPTEDA